jgi:hypothetical protein
MDLLKNTYLVTGLYVTVAILVVLLGLWREHIFREKSNNQQNELNVKQTKVNEQQQEIIRLIYKIDQLQSRRSDAISKDIGQVKNLIEGMRRQAIISDSTAKDMIEILEIKATSQSTVSDRVIEIISPSESDKGK